MPRFFGVVDRLLLLVLYVRMGLEEKEGVERGRRLYAYSFGKVTTGTKLALEEIFLHVVGRGDLYRFLVEALDVCPQRFISALDDRFERSL